MKATSNRTAILILLLAACLLTAGVLTAATMSTADVQPHPADPRKPPSNASSLLVRSEGGIAMTLDTGGLDEGAYTVWWVIFNHPEECLSSPCTSADLSNPLVGGVSILADGDIVGKNGKAHFAAGLSACGGAGCLTEPEDAEIHLVVRGHGPVQPDELHAQISTSGGGCGPCSNQQFVIHLP